MPSFRIRAEGLNARVTEDVDRSIRGEAANVDARHVQPFLTYKLSRTVNAALTIAPMDGAVEIVGGGAIEVAAAQRRAWPRVSEPV